MTLWSFVIGISVVWGRVHTRCLFAETIEMILPAFNGECPLPYRGRWLKWWIDGFLEEFMYEDIRSSENLHVGWTQLISESSLLGMQLPGGEESMGFGPECKA